MSLEGLDAGSHEHPHAVVGVDVAVQGAHLVAEHALQRDRGGIDEGDLKAALAGRGGDLRPDPASPDHDDRAPGVEPVAQGVGVLQAAQAQYAVELAAGKQEPARLGPRGQQEPS